MRSRSFRPAVIARDGLVCRDSWLCRARGERRPDELEADHVHELQDDGVDHPDNGVMLCKRHHLRKTNRERRRRERRATKATARYGGAVLALTTAATIVVTLADGHLQRLHGLAAILAAYVLAIGMVYRWEARIPGTRTPSVPPNPGKVDERDRLAKALAKMFRDGEQFELGRADEGYLLEYSETTLDAENDSVWLRMRDIASTYLGGRWIIDADTVNDRAVIRRRREFPKVITHPGLSDPTRPWSWLPYGVDETGEVAALDLSVTAHVLVTGNTGGGKTSMMRSLICALADSGTRGQVEVVLLDPKVVEFAEYRGLPGITAVHTDTAEIYDALVAAGESMRKRYDSGRPEDFPALVLVVDELRVLRSRMLKEAIRRNQLDKDDPQYEPVKPNQKQPGPALEALDEILFLGRTGNVRGIFGVQRPDASVVGGDVRAQMEGRVQLGRPDPDGAKMMFGSARWGSDIPVGTKGRATVQAFDGTPREVQCWFVDSTTAAVA